MGLVLGEPIDTYLRDICTVNQGLQISIANRHKMNDENRYFYITVQFLKKNAENYYIENPLPSTICHEDDILVVRTGSTGKIITGIKGCFHNNFFKVNYDKSKIVGKYLFYCLNTKEKQKEMAVRAGITTIPDLTHFMFLDIKIPLHKLQTQQKIANILSSLDAKIELNNKINKELESMAKTLYDYWFVQFDFPNADGKPYKSSGEKMVYNKELKREIPAGWKVKQLGEIIAVERGISYKSNELNNDGIPMVNLNSFYLNGSYKSSGIKYYTGKYNQNKIVKSEDLIIATTDVTRNADIIGKATLIPNIYSGDIVLSCDIAKITVLEDLDKYYLEKLFNSKHYHNYIRGFASGTLILHLNMDGINWHKAIIPQKKILNKFSSLMKNIQEKKDLSILENQTLTKQRDFLLPMLMNGQVSVK